MNCQTIQSLLPEFADERLDAAAAWQMQIHLSACAECERLRRDLEAVPALLQALPVRSPSAGFDAALAQRLALTRRPIPQALSWRTRWAPAFAACTFSMGPRRRSVFALSITAAAALFLAALPSPLRTPTDPAAVRSTDPAFVADCVAQHRRDVSAEPLADLSAQTLSGSLDGTVPGSAPGAADTSADPSLL